MDNTQHIELQRENEELKMQLAQLRREHTELKIEHEELKIEHEELKIEHEDLQLNYSENIIVQSMNDMKEKYEQLQKNTIPLFKYQLLNEKYKTFVKNFSGCIVLTEHVIKVLRQIEDNNNNSHTRKNLVYKAEIELMTLKDILEATL